MTTKTICVTNSPKPPPEPGPELPPPSRPLPGTPKPGDPPGPPRPGDSPPSEPKPGSPGPVRPQTIATLLLLLALLPTVGLAQSAADAIDDNDIKIDERVRLAAVSLLGNVSSLAAKRAPEHDAENTLGVRRVINHLKVKVADWPGDAAVTQRTQQALARDAHLAR
jgi:hypothetical protein